MKTARLKIKRLGLPVAWAAAMALTTGAAPLLAADLTGRAASGDLQTALLEPSSIHIALEDLPAPYATASATLFPSRLDVPTGAILNVPAGFKVNVWAEGFASPRWLALTPQGDVLLASSKTNTVYLLKDTTGDGRADTQHVFADTDNGANVPFGMVFSGDDLLLANVDSVLRFEDASGATQLTGTGELIATLPGEGFTGHWTRNLALSPDGKKLLVAIGSRSNVDVEPPPRASVLEMNLDGTGQRVFASGLRNPVGLQFHPCTGDLYVTVNERDGLGDELVPDYLTRIRDGEFYGWPYAYLAPGNLDPRRMNSEQSEEPELAATTRTPDVLFQSHSAALGLAFYRGANFPNRYRSGLYVTMRGSWNRSVATGHKVVFVPFDGEGRPTGVYEDFVTGFLDDPAASTTWGRPVGIVVLADGTLLFADEYNGRLYRVRYEPEQAAGNE